MPGAEDEEKRLRLAALQNVQAIVAARQRAEQELLSIKEKLEEETRILELLNRTGTMLASNLDLHSLVQAVTDAGTGLSGAELGAFFYRMRSGPEGDGFALYAVSGAPRDALDVELTFRGEGIIRIGDVHKDGPPHRMPFGDLPISSYLAVPVISRSGLVFGALSFGHTKRDVFSERSERLIVGLAAQAAIAIDNASLYEETKRVADVRAQLLENERNTRIELERVGMMKDEFLTTLSHELRTPLNSILGWSEVLLGRESTSSAARHGLDTIARNARAQSQLIEDLLDMNRIVSGKLRLDVQRIDISGIVAAALDSMRPSMEVKGINVRATVDPVSGVVFGDPNRLQQIVWNLLSNAVKFTPKGGEIDVVVQRLESQVEVAVRDSGIGIRREFLPHLFERFRQADSSITRTYGGLGIGLSIVKQLVDAHGGTVTVDSPGEGQGSTFVVRLPVRADRATGEREHAMISRQERQHTTPDVSLAGAAVLVVDDEPDARNIVKTVLEEAGATVHVAATAAEGLAILTDRRPHVIVSDIGMAGRDGYMFIRDVRALPVEAGGAVPAVALTAFARSEDRTRALLAGYQVHVAKPIEPRELVATVKSLAGRAMS